MSTGPQKLNYPDLSTAPQTSGVYAWYSSLTIWRSDLVEFEHRVNELKGNRDQVYKYVEERLDSLVFRKYREDNYEITFWGPLKPKYQGEARHLSPASSSLIERLIDDPTRLQIIAYSVENAVPFFTAPLYIGMARNLRERLTKHKSLIDSLYDSQNSNKSKQTLDPKDGDVGFARQVVARGFDPMSLVVYVQEVDVRTNEHIDVESILNRINFPIFGRN